MKRTRCAIFAATALELQCSKEVTMRRMIQAFGRGTTTRDTDPAPSPTPTPARSSNAAQSASSPPPSARPNGRTGTHAPTSRRTAAREAELRGQLADAAAKLLRLQNEKKVIDLEINIIDNEK